jgi:lipid-A-disaccharide synthase
MPPRIAVVAGEASGDALGAGLIRAARLIRPDIEFVGVAGPAMREAGCAAWFGTEELSVMGLAEVVKELPRILRLRRELRARLLAERPAVYVGIDAPDFNLPMESWLHARGIRTVQYVCPSVWAWRRGRVRTLREACDHVLCLLPFEPAFLEGSGVKASFVGHPFADEIPETSDPAPARRELGLAASPVVGLLPGSRLGEVERLGPDFLECAARLEKDFPGIEYVAAMATPAVRRRFESQMAARGGKPAVRLVDGRPRDVMAASDVVLAASGTVTLEAMLIGRPMVAAYRVAPLSYRLGRLLVRVRWFSLPNLLAGEPLVPELLQQEVTPDRLAAAIGGLLGSPDRRAAIVARFAELHRVLRRGASERAARKVLEVAGLV